MHVLYRDEVEGAGLGGLVSRVHLPPLDMCGRCRIGVAGVLCASLHRGAGMSAAPNGLSALGELGSQRVYRVYWLVRELVGTRPTRALTP